MSVKVLHTADLHIDSPFTFLTEGKAVFRRKMQFSILEAIVSLAEQHRVDALLICGDLFDRPNVSYETANRVSEILSTTAIPVFVTPGNHDYFHIGSPYNLDIWPENVHIFTSTAIEQVELPHINIYGAGFTTPNLFRSMLSGFTLKVTEGLQKPSVIMLHGEANPADPLYAPVYTGDISACGADYLALGHIHARTEPQKAGNTVYSFCGCPEGRGFDEIGSKGVYLVEFDSGVNVSFLPLNGAKYYDISVDLNGCDSPNDAILSTLPSDSQKNLFRITLTGQIEPDLISIEEIEECIAPLVFHANIINRTRKPLNVWGQCGEDTLRGIFLSLLKEQTDGQVTDDEKELIELAAHYGLDALDGEEPEYLDNI